MMQDAKSANGKLNSSMNPATKNIATANRATENAATQHRSARHMPTADRQPTAGVTVIGGGLGGLSAAIHLSLAGYDVTIYESNERVGGRANLLERDGFRFDTGPSLLNYPWVFEQLFEAAGRDLRDYVTLLPVDPSVSFQWPDNTRLTLSSNLQKLLEELERLEPGIRPRALA